MALPPGLILACKATYMDSRRSKKAHSIRTEAKSSSTAKIGRPQLGERTVSASSGGRRRQSQTKRPADSIRTSGVADRDSKAGISHDPFFSPYRSPQRARLAEQFHSNDLLKNKEDVCCNSHSLMQPSFWPYIFSHFFE